MSAQFISTLSLAIRHHDHLVTVHSNVYGIKSIVAMFQEVYRTSNVSYVYNYYQIKCVLLPLFV